ncbi:MAG: hypothetical protein Kow00127_13030 [Bacteroidales bacterium]
MNQSLRFLAIVISALWGGMATAQYLSNPSFEGIPAPATAPPGWEICTPVWSTPDIQPGNFNVFLPPSDGNTYLGMTARDDFTWEDVHTSLITPLSADSCYTIKIDLAFWPDVATYNMEPITLKIYGSQLSCDKTNELWQSPAVGNEEWQTYQFTVIPENDITDLVLEAYYVGSNVYWGYILMDNIRVIPPPRVDLGEDTTVVLCEGEYFTLNAGGGFASYLWSDGSSDSLLNINQTGQYWVQVTSESGCQASDTINIEVLEYDPLVPVMADSLFICPGQQIQINLEVTGGAGPFTFEWTELPDTLNTVTVMPDTTTWYHVTVTDKCGLQAEDSIKIVVLPLPEIDLGDEILICGGGDTILNAGSGFFSYLWNTGSTDSVITVNQTGYYWVTVTGAGGCQASDTVLVSYYPEAQTALPQDTAFCSGDSVLLDAGGGFLQYLWFNGSVSQSVTVSQPGWYWVTVVDQNGCETTDTVNVQLSPAETVSLGPDTTICSGDEFFLSPGSNFTGYQWQNGATTPSIQVTQPGLYWVVVTDIYGCTGSDSVFINLAPSPEPDLGNDTVICYGETLVLDPGGQFSSYLWQDNSTMPFYTVSSTGIYSCTVTNLYGCSAEDEIYVQVNRPQAAFGNDTLLCSGDTLWLDGGENAEFLWQDGTTERYLMAESGGWYWVLLSDTIGCQAVDSIFIDELPKPWSTLEDTVICGGDPVVLSAPDGPFEYLWNGNAGSAEYTVYTEGQVLLSISNLCGTVYDTVMVEAHDYPVIELGEDRVLSPGESVTLVPGPGYENYLWQDGSTGETLEVTADGIDPENPWFTVIVTDNGCAVTDSVKIEVFEVWVPSVITPNNDQINDRFMPDLSRWSAVRWHEIRVFNRWGEEVWRSNHFEDGWDGKQNGKPVADGTYFWVLTVKYGNDLRTMELRGSLTVLSGD